LLRLAENNQPPPHPNVLPWPNIHPELETTLAKKCKESRGFFLFTKSVVYPIDPVDLLLDDLGS
jgi:hypothetical protein